MTIAGLPEPYFRARRPPPRNRRGGSEPVALAYAIRADQGARNYQEDAAAVRPRAGGLVAVLADGMGGHAGGAVASEVASTRFLDAFVAAEGDERGGLAAALDSANVALAERAAGRPELRGMGCTLIGASFGPAGLDWISVGDSPLYLVRRTDILRLNEDHSLAPELDRLAAEGRISWDRARLDPRRHVLRSALMGSEIELIDASEAPQALQPGDVVVLASDGIHTIPEAEIARLVAAAETPDAAAEALLAAVGGAGDPHQDNTTVVVVRVLQEPS
jgi:PPM family protein phosphatase